MVMNMPGCHLIQMAVRAVTHLILHLNCSVRNMVFVHQEILDTFQQRIMVVRRNDLSVQCHDRFFADHPDMHVVYVANFGDFPA